MHAIVEGSELSALADCLLSGKQLSPRCMGVRFTQTGCLQNNYRDSLIEVLLL